MAYSWTAVTPNTQTWGSSYFNFCITGDVRSQIPAHSIVKMQGGSGTEYTVTATFESMFGDTTWVRSDDNQEIDPVDRALYGGGTLLVRGAEIPSIIPRIVNFWTI